MADTGYMIPLLASMQGGLRRRCPQTGLQQAIKLCLGTFCTTGRSRAAPSAIQMDHGPFSQPALETIPCHSARKRTSLLGHAYSNEWTSRCARTSYAIMQVDKCASQRSSLSLSYRLEALWRRSNLAVALRQKTITTTLPCAACRFPAYRISQLQSLR